MRPSDPVVEPVVIFGKLVSAGESEVMVRGGRLVSLEVSEDVDVGSAVEDCSDVSTLMDVFDGAAVDAADAEDLPSVDVSDKAGSLGACASAVVKGNIANRNKNLMGGRFSLVDPRIVGKMIENIKLRGGAPKSVVE